MGALTAAGAKATVQGTLEILAWSWKRAGQMLWMGAMGSQSLYIKY